MDSLLTTYLDNSYTDFAFSLLALVPAGLVLALVSWSVGFAVTWLINLIRSATR